MKNSLILFASILSLLTNQTGFSQPECSMPPIRSWIHLTETSGFNWDTLWFGSDTLATFGIDSQFCEAELIPPSYLFVFRDLPGRTNLGNGVLIDFHPMVSPAQVDSHRIFYGVNWPTEYTFHWSPPGLRAICDSAVLVDQFGSLRFRLDLEDSLYQTSNSVVLYLIRYGVKSPTTSVGPSSDLIQAFELYQNYPNPFNPATTLRYHLAERSFVVLDVLDMVGSIVATLSNGFEAPGFKTVVYDASGNASGVYFARLRVGGLVEIRKLLLMR